MDANPSSLPPPRATTGAALTPGEAESIVGFVQLAGRGLACLYYAIQELRTRVKRLETTAAGQELINLGLDKDLDEVRAAFNQLLSLDTFRPFVQSMGKPAEEDDGPALP